MKTRSKITGSGGIRTHDQRLMSPWEPLQLLNSLSVTKISELSKFSKSYISQVKHGKCPPSKRLLETLAGYNRCASTRYDYFNLFLRSRQAMGVSSGTEPDIRQGNNLAICSRVTNSGSNNVTRLIYHYSLSVFINLVLSKNINSPIFRQIRKIPKNRFLQLLFSFFF